MRLLGTALVVLLSFPFSSCGGRSTPGDPVPQGGRLELTVPARVDAARSADLPDAFEAVVTVVVQESGGSSARLESIAVAVPSNVTEHGAVAWLGVKQLFTTDHIPAYGRVELPIRVYTGPVTSSKRSWSAQARLQAVDEHGQRLTTTGDFLFIAPE